MPHRPHDSLAFQPPDMVFRCGVARLAVLTDGSQMSDFAEPWKWTIKRNHTLNKASGSQSKRRRGLPYCRKPRPDVVVILSGFDEMPDDHTDAEKDRREQNCHQNRDMGSGSGHQPGCDREKQRGSAGEQRPHCRSRGRSGCVALLPGMAQVPGQRPAAALARRSATCRKCATCQSAVGLPNCRLERPGLSTEPQRGRPGQFIFSGLLPYRSSTHDPMVPDWPTR